MNYQKVLSNLRNNDFFLPLSIFLSGLAIMIFFAFPSFRTVAFPQIDFSIPFIQYSYQKHAEIDDLSNIYDVITSQPAITVAGTKTYYLVELCKNSSEQCKEFRRNHQKKVLNDFVKPRTVTYTWLDYPDRDKLIFNKALYCIIDQRASLLPKYMEFLGNTTSNNEESQVNQFAAENSLKEDTFASCTKDKKYEPRIQKLQLMSESLSNGDLPVLLVYRLENDSVQSIDGSNKKRDLASLVGVIEMSNGYDEKIKKQIQAALN